MSTARHFCIVGRLLGKSVERDEVQLEERGELDERACWDVEDARRERKEKIKSTKSDIGPCGEALRILAARMF